MEADSDSDLDDGDISGLDGMLDKFKKLQAKASKSSLGEYLELPKEIGEISLSCSQMSDVEDTDLYLTSQGDLIVWLSAYWEVEKAEVEETILDKDKQRRDD